MYSSILFITIIKCILIYILSLILSKLIGIKIISQMNFFDFIMGVSVGSMIAKIVIDKEESYSANCIWVNDTVLIPKGYPKTKEAIENKGYKVVEVDTSEYRKIDGGLSCLSLRF